MLTVSDFINLIQYYKHSSYSAAMEEIEQFQIQQLRGNCNYNNNKKKNNA